MINETPTGFIMPPEWAPHRATWMAWPANKNDWPGKFTLIPWVIAEIVKKLHLSEKACILIDNPLTEKRAERILRQRGVKFDNIKFYRCPYDRSWLRDSGPLFVKNGEEKHAILWKFNAWSKYKNFRHDLAVGAFIQKMTKARPVLATYRGEWIVMEGGAVDVDGQGFLMATKECLLSPIQERNPEFVQEDYEKIFSKYFGAKKIIWLKGGLKGDDTHGHIDDVARFVAPGHVVAARETNSRDANFPTLEANLLELQQSGLIITELPMPSPLYFDGQRLPASYLNFYIGNEVVLVPTFNDPRDREALEIMAKLFPTREVAGIHAVDLVWGLGTIHCLTQPEPV